MYGQPAHRNNLEGPPATSEPVLFLRTPLPLYGILGTRELMGKARAISAVGVCNLQPQPDAVTEILRNSAGTFDGAIGGGPVTVSLCRGRRRARGHPPGLPVRLIRVAKAHGRSARFGLDTPGTGPPAERGPAVIIENKELRPLLWSKRAARKFQRYRIRGHDIAVQNCLKRKCILRDFASEFKDSQFNRDP